MSTPTLHIARQAPHENLGLDDFVVCRTDRVTLEMVSITTGSFKGSVEELTIGGVTVTLGMAPINLAFTGISTSAVKTVRGLSSLENAIKAVTENDANGTLERVFALDQKGKVRDLLL